MAKKTTMVSAGAVAAAAAAAVGLTVARRMNAQPEIWHVRPGESGWSLTRDGADAANSTHGTKKEAIAAGRRTAGGRAPSTLVLHYADGREQRRIEYGG